MTSHPAERFVAPASIQHGVPLAELIGPESVQLLAESFEPVIPDFNADRFLERALTGIESLALMQRGSHVAEALAEQLPVDFADAAPLLIASLGPELGATQGTGLAPFFYLPHSQYIAHYGPGSPEAALWACYELTKRFTSEFCIRSLLVAHPQLALAKLRDWTVDANPHVRRLVSEGTRPRLPWGMRLKQFQADPRPTIELLEMLKDDAEPYVYRSVANHVADIWKDNPQIAVSICERWLDEVSENSRNNARAASRRWIVRHALRLPAKKGDQQALKLRQRAGRSG